ncbi:MAG: serine/threonine-protein kinase [Gemmatimonadales bacterium]
MVIESHVLTEVLHAADRATSPAAVRVLARLSERYAVDRELGRGGMGIVYVARDVKLGRQVAIKVLDPTLCDQLGQDRFLREIRLTASLQHPHILPVLDSGCMSGTVYYVSPCLAEGSLYSLLRTEGRLPVEHALRIGLDILEALAYAHCEGVVHCDLKPENILLSNGHAILADFGIARTMNSLTREALGHVWGSPVYMSPEQAVGEVDLDGRSDVYSMACVLYETLTGTPPFAGSSPRAIIARKFSAPPPELRTPGSRIPHPVVAAVVRALAIDPAERFTTARGFADELSRGFRNTSRDRAPSRRRWQPTITTLIGSATLAALALLA